MPRRCSYPHGQRRVTSASESVTKDQCDQWQRPVPGDQGLEASLLPTEVAEEIRRWLVRQASKPTTTEEVLGRPLTSDDLLPLQQVFYGDGEK